MNRNRTTLAIAAVLAAGVALAGCKRDQHPADTAMPPPAASEPASTPEIAPAAHEAPAASIRVTEVKLGTSVGDDRKVSDAKTSFAPSDDTIFAAVSTNAPDGAGPVAGNLTARWTYQDGQVVDEHSEQANFMGDDVTNFRISSPQAWPEGNYKVEILLDGKVVETRDFTIGG